MEKNARGKVKKVKLMGLLWEGLRLREGDSGNESRLLAMRPLGMTMGRGFER